MKRVLLTGGSGFVGRHVLPLLRGSGFEVHVVTSRDGGPHDGATWHTCDLLDPAPVSKLFAEVSPTHLMHLAWYAETGRYWTSLENFRWVSASLNLLAAFHRNGGKRVVMAGTCAEYDAGAKGYCVEQRTPLSPKTVYGTCKHALQLLLHAYASEARLSSAWARLFYLYGPCEKPDRLVPSVIRGLLRGEPVPCTHGEQIRDFLHVEDVAAALVTVFESRHEGPINIASGNPIALKDIIRIIAREIGREDLVRLGALHASPNEPATLVGDTHLLAQLGWQPRIQHDRGLHETIGWWRTRTAEPAT